MLRLLQISILFSTIFRVTWAAGAYTEDIESGDPREPYLAGNPSSSLHGDIEPLDLRSESNADSDIMWPSSSVGGTANFNDIIFPTDHHHRMSTVALYCGQRIDAMSLAWQDMEATGSAKPAPLLRRHGGSSGTLKQPILALDAGRYIYKVVAHNAYHDKHQPLRLGYLELHVATWNTAPDGSRSMGKYWNPVTCGTPSKFPVSVLTRTEDQHTFVRDGHAVLSFFGTADTEIEQLGVTWVPLNEY